MAQPTDFNRSFLPSELSLSDLAEVLSDPSDINYHRMLARLLENTTSIDKVLEYIDEEKLIEEFPKVTPYMSHASLEESNQNFWKEQIKKIAKELGKETNVETSYRDAVDPQAIPDPQAAQTEGTQATQPEAVNASGADEPFGRGGAEAKREKERRGVAKKLTDVRQEVGISRGELAENCTLNLSEISALESGRTEPTYHHLRAYADGLNRELKLEFRDPDRAKGNLLLQARKFLTEGLEEQDLTEEDARLVRVMLMQLGQDVLHREHIQSVHGLISRVEEAAREFSIRPEEPDPEQFSDPDLYNLVRNLLENWSDLTLMAFDEKVSFVAQRAMEQVQDREIEW